MSRTRNSDVQFSSRFGEFAQRDAQNASPDTLAVHALAARIKLKFMNAIDAPFRAPQPHTTALLDDTQARRDDRHLAIQRVGIRALRHPVRVANTHGEPQSTIATFSMYVGLAETQKGAHMSRFAQLLEEGLDVLTPASFLALADAMQKRLEADSSHLEMRFPYFRRKKAPISGVESLLDADVAFIVDAPLNGAKQLIIEVIAPVTSLCPCSKKISDYGAHNQRSHVTIRAEASPELSIDALIEIAEREASSELYGVLKRVDEKFVTERAYDNPKFVEDLVRDIALACGSHSMIGEFMVASENFESIHNHSAYAELYGRGKLNGS
jgi:GTP cyclohydrolase IB